MPHVLCGLNDFYIDFFFRHYGISSDAGHHMNKSKVTFYMLLTIIGGAVFVGLKLGNGKILSRENTEPWKPKEVKFYNL